MCAELFEEVSLAFNTGRQHISCYLPMPDSGEFLRVSATPIPEEKATTRRNVFASWSPGKRAYRPFESRSSSVEALCSGIQISGLRGVKLGEAILRQTFSRVLRKLRTKNFNNRERRVCRIRAMMQLDCLHLAQQQVLWGQRG